MTTKLERIGIHFTLSKLIGWIAKWLIIIATFITVADTFGLQKLPD